MDLKYSTNYSQKKETYIDITKEILPEENYIEREGRGAVISGLFIV